MIAPISGDVIRRALRTVVVAAIGVSAIGLSNLQMYLAAGPLNPHVPEFITSANIVDYADQHARAAGILPGDRIDYSLMPPDERYGADQDGLRVPPAGKSVSYVVEHRGTRHTVTFAGLTFGGERRTVLAGITYDASSRRAWFSQFKHALSTMAPREAAILVLVLLASALVLIRPAALTIAFFLFAAGWAAIIPYYYAFLPPQGYAALMVLSDVLVAFGGIGLLAFALYLDPRRHVRSSRVIATGVALLAIIVVPVAISDVSELIVGARPVWPLAGWASFLALLFCYVGGIALLLQLAASTEAPRLRLLAALLAITAATMLFGRAQVQWNSWYFTNLPTAAFNRQLLPNPEHLRWPLWFAIPFMPVSVLRPFALLLAFYMIVRSKIVDTGPVLARMVAYVIIVLLVIAVFAEFNIIFAQVLPSYPLLVPLEIFAAGAIGYWLSGLRDVAGSLSLAGVDAWSSWAKGQSREEHDALTHALRLAERTRRRALIAEVRAQIVFSSWRDGDDGEFERNAAALVRVLENRNLRGLRAFALAATSGVDEQRFREDDLPEWRACAELLRCARTDDAARAQQHATDAMVSADRAGLALLQVLASVAVAESRSDQRDVSLERAHNIARDAGWPALSKSILALRANARDLGILQPFVEVRLRKSRPGRPAFEISFFEAELRQNGKRIPLAENELELLLTVASAPAGLKDIDLIDELWPESDGDAARNAFRVCLHRLRKKSGDARIVTRVGKGYVVHPWADVDLWRFDSLIVRCRESRGKKGATELQELCDAVRAGGGHRGTLGEWFYRFEQALTRRLDEAQQLLDRGATRYA